MPPVSRIPPSVARELRYYVYLYVDPFDDSVFYVGKGKGNRACGHLEAMSDKAIAQRIREIRKGGAEPRVDILAHGLRNEAAALRIEAAAIDLLGLPNLTNVVHGHGVKYGRMRLEDAVAHYTRKPARIQEPSLLIRIHRAYRFGMSDQELYDATRSAWKVGKRADDAELAFAIDHGVERKMARTRG